MLVAEDEALVSMLIEEELSEAGFRVVGPFRTCAGASAWLERNTPDIATIDYQLADGPCTDLAAELRRRGVPFVLLTGLPPEDMPEPFRGAPMFQKPSSLDKLSETLAGLLPGRGSV